VVEGKEKWHGNGVLGEEEMGLGVLGKTKVQQNGKEFWKLGRQGRGLVSPH
jgi:hypothetical protein